MISLNEESWSGLKISPTFQQNFDLRWKLRYESMFLCSCGCGPHGTDVIHTDLSWQGCNGATINNNTRNCRNIHCNNILIVQINITDLAETRRFLDLLFSRWWNMLSCVCVNSMISIFSVRFFGGVIPTPN